MALIIIRHMCVNCDIDLPSSQGALVLSNKRASLILFRAAKLRNCIHLFQYPQEEVDHNALIHFLLTPLICIEFHSKNQSQRSEVKGRTKMNVTDERTSKYKSENSCYYMLLFVSA